MPSAPTIPRLAVVRCQPGHAASPLQPEHFEPIVAAVAGRVARLDVTELGVLTFAVRGPARYFGGESSMVATISDAVQRAAADHAWDGGIGLGIADGRSAATLAANAALHNTDRHVIVQPGREATAAYLAELPVARLEHVPGLDALGIDHSFVDMLHRLGIVRLGQLAALGVADVLARFGHAGAFAWRIASGDDDRPPDTSDPPAGFDVRQVFDEPIPHRDTVVFAGRQLADQLVTSLAEVGQVCTQLMIAIETDHGERSERVWYRPEGLSAIAIVERIRWQLDGWAHVDISAGVTLVVLQPEQVRADTGVQLALWGGRTQADEWAQRAVARLAGIAGEAQVLVPVSVGGRHHGEMYRWTSAASTDLANSDERLQRPTGPWPGQLPAPSPATVLQRPQPVEVTDGEGAPVRVNGRGLISTTPRRLVINGRHALIEAWAGPWPVEERWWDLRRSTRQARFQILTDDGYLRLVVIDRQRWWLHAIYT